MLFTITACSAGLDATISVPPSMNSFSTSGFFIAAAMAALTLAAVSAGMPLGPKNCMPPDTSTPA